MRNHLAVAALAMIAGANVPSGPHRPPDGTPMSDAERERLDAERLRHAPRRIRRAEEKRKRKAAKSLGDAASQQEARPE